MLINHDFSSDSPQLTARQQEVLDCLASHMTSKEIARTLGISPSMVDQHLRAISNKLGGLPRRELARLQTGRSANPALPGSAGKYGQQVPGIPELVPAGGNLRMGFLCGFAFGLLVVITTLLSVALVLQAFY